jgi:hypothetical protein
MLGFGRNGWKIQETARGNCHDIRIYLLVCSYNSSVILCFWITFALVFIVENDPARCHGMMQIPVDEIEAFLQWIHQKQAQNTPSKATFLCPRKFMQTITASYIFNWVHREGQPEIHAVFDGSSNHTSRALDGLQVGGGINKGFTPTYSGIKCTEVYILL